jgi:hypothetical protein
MRPMTATEKVRLKLVVDGYKSFAKAFWVGWAILLCWRIYLWIAGAGSIGDVTLFALFVLLPIAVSGLAEGATSAHSADLKGGVAAGLSALVDEVGGGFLIVKGERFDMPNKLTQQITVGDMVAVEFAPTTRLVLQVHRLRRPEPVKRLETSDENEGIETVAVE